MKKIKLYLTYFIAIICVGSTLFYRPKESMILETISYSNEDLMMIYMVDEEDLIPVSLFHTKSEFDEENIKTLFHLMKQPLKILHFQPVISPSIQCLDVHIQENVVQLDLNEAFFTMNSKSELRFIESIVSSVTHLNKDYQVEFYVNHKKVKEMPLSGLVMGLFDNSLGVNNFSIDVASIHSTMAKQIVSRKENDDVSYYVVSTQRIPTKTELLTFMNDILHKTSYSLTCEKVEFIDDKLILHLNQAFLVDETTIDAEKIECLLYTLKMNEISDKFELKVNNETVKISNYPKEILYFEELNLNVFEE